MFAILFEALLIEIQEEIPHFPSWEGGGLMGAKIVNKIFVNKLAFPIGIEMFFFGVSRPPCPTYQLWLFSSARENHPKMPVRDPQNEFPGIPWIGLFLGLTILFNRKP